LYCYCVALLLFVLSYVLIVCTVPLPPGVNPISVDKYIKINSSPTRSHLLAPEFCKYENIVVAEMLTG